MEIVEVATFKAGKVYSNVFHPLQQRLSKAMGSDTEVKQVLLWRYVSGACIYGQTMTTKAL